MTLKGDRLAEIRKDHGDTQITLAEKLNVGRFTVSSWEQGKSEPSHDMLVRICRLYHVSADYLLGISNTDPAYEKRKSASLSENDLSLLKEMTEFLLWRKKQKKEKKH